MTNSQSVEQDGIVAGNIFAMLNNALQLVSKGTYGLFAGKTVCY